MATVGGVLTFVLAFVVLITIVVIVHEGGHYVLAKLSGIRVDEFAVGFGPRLLRFRRGETVYAVRVLPLGGFVRMAGMLGIEGEEDAGARNFYRASLWKKMLTVLAGIISNFILGAICLAIVATQSIPSGVTAAGPADRAGVRSGDTIISVNGMTIDSTSTDAAASSLYSATLSSNGLPVPVVLQHSDGSSARGTITPHLVVYTGSGCQRESVGVTQIDGHSVGNGDPARLLTGHTIGGVIESSYSAARGHQPLDGLRLDNVSDGGTDGDGLHGAWRIGYSPGIPSKSPLSAIGAGISHVAGFIGDTARGLAEVVVHPSCAQQFSGPVGIASAADDSFRAGAIPFINLIGLISLSLGFVNVLPIPFLDGGRFLFLVIEGIRGRRLDPKHEAATYAVGLAVLILIFVAITLSDINNLSAGAR
ncbi:MAG: M50 family metallopeptidase [Candidatus Dormibacteria bacterium]